MNSEDLGPLILGAVCVLVIVFAAATITSPTETGGGDVETGEGGEGGVGNDPGGSGIDIGGDEAEDSGLVELREGDRFLQIPAPCLTFLHDIRVILGIVAAFLVLGYVMKRRQDALAAVAVCTTFSIPVVLVYLLLATCDTSDGTTGLPEHLAGGGSGSDGGVGVNQGEVAVDPTIVPTWVYVVVGIAFLGVLAYAFSSRGGLGSALDPILPSSDEDDEDEAGPQPTAAALGELAGQAADRIEEETGTTVENEVYRAWREMTRPLEVDRPESSTPAEFASAATEAGVDHSDVEELTELFEEVRYGGYDADADRESRAVDLLRRIERQYTDEDGGDRP